MDRKNPIGDLIKQPINGEGSAMSDANADGLFDQLTSRLKGSRLASIICPALSSLGTQVVVEQVARSASAMNDRQRAGVVGTLLGGFDTSGMDIQLLLEQLEINPSVADNPAAASAKEVAKLAAHAHENDPSLFEKAMDVYNQDPLLIQTLGAIVVAAIVRYLTEQDVAL